MKFILFLIFLVPIFANERIELAIIHNCTCSNPEKSCIRLVKFVTPQFCGYHDYVDPPIFQGILGPSDGGMIMLSTTLLSSLALAMNLVLFGCLIKKKFAQKQETSEELTNFAFAKL
uniref:Uncharacterized protein n=1 Tax=Panagrolaimus sp. JU765 TaxID=591449 RepID=A0AC34QDD1_9BILA